MIKLMKGIPDAKQTINSESFNSFYLQLFFKRHHTVYSLTHAPLALKSIHRCRNDQQPAMGWFLSFPLWIKVSSNTSLTFTYCNGMFNLMVSYAINVSPPYIWIKSAHQLYKWLHQVCLRVRATVSASFVLLPFKPIALMLICF